MNAKVATTTRARGRPHRLQDLLPASSEPAASQLSHRESPPRTRRPSDRAFSAGRSPGLGPRHLANRGTAPDRPQIPKPGLSCSGRFRCSRSRGRLLPPHSYPLNRFGDPIQDRNLEKPSLDLTAIGPRRSLDVIPPRYYGRMAMPRKYTDDQLIEAVKVSRSIAQVLRGIRLRPAGGNHKTVKARIKELGLDTAHFRGQGWLKGTNIRTSPRKPIEAVLTKESTFRTSHLRLRLLESGLKEHVWERCGLSEWNSLPIPLELDHLNGINSDNRLTNLRVLCPNCHAQTSNYRGKNIRVSSEAPVVQ